MVGVAGVGCRSVAVARVNPVSARTPHRERKPGEPWVSATWSYQAYRSERSVGQE